MDMLLRRQAEILDAIKQIDRNFKKDPSSRKTRQYLDAKLESIDKLWSEFNSNDNKLEAFKDDSQYFAEEQYDRAKEYYTRIRFMIASHQPVPSLQHKPVVSSQDAELKVTTAVSTPSDVTGRAGTPSPLPAPAPRDSHQQLAPAPVLQSELEKLLSQQRTNFRALSRQIQGINLYTIIDKWELEEELRNLQTRWDTIDKLHLKIDHMSQGSNIQYEHDFSYNETIYKNMRRSIYQKLSATSHLQQSTPTIDIPVFTGKYIQWPTFFDLFNETIHNNNFLTKCQKMQHLKGKLKGEAERLIQHLNISADNYDTAWDLLTRRYNNTQLLFTKNLETFLNQPTVQKQTAYEIKRLYDTSMECIHAIQNLGVNISSWDPILVHLICKKLDPVSYNDYKEARKSPRDLPLLKELMSFLEGKFTALEEISKKDLIYVYRSNLNTNQSPANKSSNINQFRSSNRNGKFQTNTTRVWNCPFCKQKHNLFKCNKFAQLGPDAKLKTVKKLDICMNCLFSHDGNACNSNKLCKICHGKHNSILHDSFASCSALPSITAAASNLMHASPSASAPNKLLTAVVDRHHSVNYVSNDDEEILLTTLLIKVKAADGSYITLRALLDQGSQISLISENAAQWLGLPRSRYHASISGIGYGSKQSKGVLNLSCQSIYGDYIFETQALVINHVINSLPSVSFVKQTWEHLQHIQLADPDYNISKPIDLLLDASVYSDILMSGLIKGPGKAPIAQQTRLGWILSGNVRTFNCSVVINNLSEISNYWESEEINERTADITESEKYCEQLFKSTTKRLESGRYEVALPMKPNFEQNLGKSKNKAIAQFISLEKKLASNEQFSQSYKQFMNEYLSLGHMKPVDNSQQGPSCYLPHHGVIKADSTTTKLRTVFNASSKTSSGNSLNDLMERGPNLQKDLHSLILIWRQHKYVITADIEKMFRQILVNESAQHLQRIVWRESRGDPLREYQLTTITYGTKAAPYLAMRTLRQLADDDAQKYPLAAAALKNSFYMDDLLEGCNTLEQAKELQQQLINILKGAGMKIRKWSSNDPDLIQNLSSEDVDSSLDFRCTESRKTLGLRWNPKYDTFSFKNIFYDINDDTHITKRQLLSHISKVFDPVGWLAPLTIRAKLLFQKTWSDDYMTWDQRLPPHLVEEWQQLKQDLQNIEIFEIPRYFGESDQINLYAFCDSSEKAYACTIFVSTRNAKGEYIIMLLTAKTKLAPIKNKLTLPRLELCSALLLSRLITKVRQALHSKINKIHAFTDSMIVLGWIHGDINRWKQFVATRVKQITDVIPSSCWHHVESKHNPADCATRGMTAAQLKGHSLWWEGPEWIREYDSKTTKSECYPSPDIEVKGNPSNFSVNAALTKNNAFIYQLINECSSLRRAAINLGWLSRYIVSLRNKQSVPRLSYLTSVEMQRSYNIIIRTVQKYEFEEDYQRLVNNKNISRNSKLSSLCPFIDKNDGLMRVRGRLNNSLLSSSAKHPIIISSHCRLTNLIISEAHTLTLHGGPRLTLSFIRQKYWIIGGLRTVKRELRKCVKCRRFSEQKSQQLMADLPQPRVTPSRPFTHTGVDFTGHFDIKINKGRGVKTSKGYVAVFVCFSTKAVHLELVSDLSTPGFLAAFRRFCARRGCPRRVYSDNGTNFVGANRLLKREYEQIIKTINQDFFRNIYDYNIEWVFNAPGNPEAGGLWEGAVKRMKYHLKRVVGEQKLTYEEFITVLHQIEACLNSRPLVGLTENPEDEYLTPGHFLVGGYLLSRPQTDPEHISLTTRWKMIQSMNKQFWRRWSAEYLQELQSRSKWRKTTKNLELDDIVVIKEENLPPGKWALGRIVETHPGKDGHVRVVSVKTKNGVIKRPIIKLVPLPVKEETKVMTSSPDDQTTARDVTTVSPKTQRQVCTASRNRFYNFIVTLLMLFLFTIPSIHASYNFSYFDNNQSVYFHKIKDMSLIRDEWKLVVFYNMSSYWLGLESVNKYVSHIRKITNDLELLPQYKGIQFQLEHELSEINHYNDILMIHNKNRRLKRGLVNGIGYLANSLFGVLDDRFLKQYEKDIEKIKINESYLQILLKNQTSVIEAQSNILRRNEYIMNKQFGVIQDYIRNMSLTLNGVQLHNRNELYILSSFLSAQIIISNIRSVQQNLINTVIDIWQGHMDPYILPPKQFEENVNFISGHISSDLSLPVDKSDIQSLYKLLKINAKVGTRFVIIEVRIPLVRKEQYEVDQVYSLSVNNYVMGTLTPYLAFNLQKDLLLLLTEKEVESCIHVSLEKILCSYDKPIYSVRLTKHVCDIRINNKTICNSKQTRCEERWIKLHNTGNRWLFSCCEKCPLRIFCSGNVQLITLTGNGLIDIGQGCVIKGESFSLYGHKNFFSQIEVGNRISVDPSTSVLNDIVNSTLPESFISENHDETWRDLHRRIEDIKSQSDGSLSVHDIHQYSVLYIVIAILGLLACYYLVQRWRGVRRVWRVAAAAAAAPVVFHPHAQQEVSHGAHSEMRTSTFSVDKATVTSPMAPPRLVRLDIPTVSDSECSENVCSVEN